MVGPKMLEASSPPNDKKRDPKGARGPTRLPGVDGKISGQSLVNLSTLVSGEVISGEIHGRWPRLGPGTP